MWCVARVTCLVINKVILYFIVYFHQQECIHICSHLQEASHRVCVRAVECCVDGPTTAGVVACTADTSRRDKY